MSSLRRLPLAIAFLTALIALVGCQKNEPVSVPASVAGGDKPADGAPPARPMAPGAQDQMSKALNDPNTPPEVKAKIRAQMGGQ